MKQWFLTVSLAVSALACNQKSSSEDDASQASLNNRVPSVTDGSESSGVSAAGASQNAVPAAAPVAGSCQTFDAQGLVSSCVDYQAPAYTAATGRVGCQQVNPNNRFTDGAPCTHERASGGCISPQYNTITWLYLLPDETPGSRPTPTCDDGQPATPP